ncbi:MAG: hypothetical protein MZU95_06825 [Desulfomicrobium escambiense]|nr:hypothetical protein [Desulfomicrobium escambiense]
MTTEGEGMAAGQDLAVAVEDVAAPRLDGRLVEGLAENGGLGPGVADDLDLDEAQGDDGGPRDEDCRQDLGPLPDVVLVECAHGLALSGMCPFFVDDLFVLGIDEAELFPGDRLDPAGIEELGPAQLQPFDVDLELADPGLAPARGRGRA